MTLGINLVEDSEAFMDAPSYNGGKGSGGTSEKAGGNFISNILSLLGVHTDIAKGEKAGKVRKGRESPFANQPIPDLIQPNEPDLGGIAKLIGQINAM